MKLLIVPARTGLQWVQQGIRTFRQQPLALAALFFLSMAAMSLVTVLPLVGPVIALGLLPATSLAMMVAAAEASHGRAPTPALLLVAFRTGRQRLNSMLTLGAMYAAGFLLIMGLSMLVDDGQFANVYLGGEPLTREIAESPDFQAAMWLSMGRTCRCRCCSGMRRGWCTGTTCRRSRPCSSAWWPACATSARWWSSA
jgi:hypothetical protein